MINLNSNIARLTKELLESKKLNRKYRKRIKELKIELEIAMEAILEMSEEK